MRSPALALAWEFWGRHRWGLSAVAALVLGFALASAAGPLSVSVASINSMWFVMGLCYAIGVFAYGFDGRLETAESGFPTRLFLLPVRTWVLVGWPMLLGVVVAVLLWLGWDRLVLRPSGVETPAWWPVMLAAVVATSQAIVWLPFGLPWLRLVVAIAVLTSLVRAPAFLDLAGEQFRDAETRNAVLCVVAVALLPVSFLVAWAGVGRARRGDNPDWLRAWGRVRPTAVTRTEGRPFSSAMWAQVWYEWRVRGLMLVVSTAIILVVLAALGALLERDPATQTNFGVMFLLTPVLVAPFWGSFAGMSGVSGVSARSAPLSAFAATRPLSNSALVVAKLRAAGLAAGAAWAVALVVFPAWLLYTGGYRGLGEVWDDAAAKNGTARVVGLCAVLVIGPPLVTWRMLAVGLWTGLTGRTWVLVAYQVVLGSVALRCGHEWVMWDVDADRRERILDALPWVAGAALVLKFLAAGWAIAALRRRGELGRGAVPKILGAWGLLAAGLFGLLLWLIPPDTVSVSGLALGVALFVPLTRLVVAPLALGWNRHR